MSVSHSVFCLKNTDQTLNTPILIFNEFTFILNQLNFCELDLNKKTAMELTQITKLLNEDITWDALKKILLEQNLLQELSNILYRTSVFLNKDGEIIYVNKFFTDTLGYKLDEITGNKFTSYFADTDSIKQFNKKWQSVVSVPNKLYIQEIPIRIKDKRQRIINWHFLPIYLEQKLKTVFSVGEDMTETVLLEKELILKCEELEEKNKKLSSIIKKLIDREIEMKKIKEKIRIIKNRL